LSNTYLQKEVMPAILLKEDPSLPERLMKVIEKYLEIIPKGNTKDKRNMAGGLSLSSFERVKDVFAYLWSNEWHTK